MILPLLARSVNRNRAGDVQLYTASSNQIIRFAHGALSATGPLIFARRDTDAMCGLIFGSGAAYRIGGTDANWGGASVVSKSTSGFTRTSGNVVTITTAFDWNDSAHDGDGHIVWSFYRHDTLSWSGTGGLPSAQSHNLGVVPGLVFVLGNDGGGVSDVYIWHSANPNYTWQLGMGWVDHGTPALTISASNVTPTTGGPFDDGTYTYTGRVIPGNEITPGSEKTVVCGNASAAVAETLGWEPRSLIWIDPSGNIRSWVKARDAGAGDVSSDLSTELSGTSGFNSNGQITTSATGFTSSSQIHYIAFR